MSINTHDRHAPAAPIRTRSRRLAMVAATAAALATLGACGSTVGDADKVDAETDNALVRADYENCMADQGVEVDFSEAEGNAVAEEQGSGTTIAEADMLDKLNAASEECDYILDDLEDELDGIAPKDEAEFDDWVLAINKCIADKGFFVPPDNDPDATYPPDIDWDAWDQANRECQQENAVSDGS